MRIVASRKVCSRLQKYKAIQTATTYRSKVGTNTSLNSPDYLVYQRNTLLRSSQIRNFQIYRFIPVVSCDKDQQMVEVFFYSFQK